MANPFTVNILGGTQVGDEVRSLGNILRQRQKDDALADKEQRLNNLRVQAAKGDPRAMQQLYGVDPATAGVLEKRARQKQLQNALMLMSKNPDKRDEYMPTIRSIAPELGMEFDALYKAETDDLALYTDAHWASKVATEEDPTRKFSLMREWLNDDGGRFLDGQDIGRLNNMSDEQIAQMPALFSALSGIDVIGGGVDYGQYNPRDYTAESWAAFVATNGRDPSVLVRYENPLEQRRVTAAEERNRIAEEENLRDAEREEKKLAREKKQNLTDAKNSMTDLVTGINFVDRLANHEGLEGAIGFRLGEEYVPGSEAASFVTLLDRMQAYNFVSAISKMQGLGALSDAEGDMLRAMIGALGQNQNEKSFRRELQDIRDFFAMAQRRLVQDFGDEVNQIGREEGATSGGSTKVTNALRNRIQREYGVTLGGDNGG